MTPNLRLRTFQPAPRPLSERIPVTIVTGFLGSGKTTLVNHILGRSGGRRIAVLVNEFGEIGIDADLIVASSNDVVELSNGCICCSMQSDLMDGIVRVLSHDNPIDHIIVETSGVAEPLPIACTFLRPEFREVVRLDGIVAVADAEQFCPELIRMRSYANQLHQADVILLSKGDCLSAARLTAVEAELRASFPGARVLRVDRGSLALPLILDIGSLRLERAPPRIADHVAEDGFMSVSFSSERPFKLAAFQRFLDTGRPAELFRGKGFLQFVESDACYVFHLVGERFALEINPAFTGQGNRLVFIGRSLNGARLHESLAACLADSNVPV